MIAASLKPLQILTTICRICGNLRDQMIAASLKLGELNERRLADFNLRDQMIAASLKHRMNFQSTRKIESSPRSNDRGIIEALHDHCVAVRATQSPRSNDRGMIEALALDLLRGTSGDGSPRSNDRGIIEAGGSPRESPRHDAISAIK